MTPAGRPSRWTRYTSRVKKWSAGDPAGYQEPGTARHPRDASDPTFCGPKRRPLSDLPSETTFGGGLRFRSRPHRGRRLAWLRGHLSTGRPGDLARQLESSVTAQVDPTGRTRWHDRALTAVGAMRPGDPSMGRRDPPSEPAFVSLLEPSESRRRESGPRVNGLMTTAPSDQRASERVMRHDRCSGPPRSAPPPPNPDVSRISSSPDSFTPTIASATDSAE